MTSTLNPVQGSGKGDVKHTPGPWRIGANSGAVISDHAVEHGPNGCDCVEYYGGHLIAESIAECNRPLIAAAPELIQAARAQHHALDVLMARLIVLDPTFRPTKSPAWNAVVQAHDLLARLGIDISKGSAS